MFRAKPTKIKTVMTWLMFGLALSCSQPVIAWQSKLRSSDDTAVNLPIAFEKNNRGDLSEIVRDGSGKVSLRITLAQGFIQFAADNCPTLQIDERLPVHHQTAGEHCRVDTQTVEINLGDINNDLIISLPLHRLMNGSQLAVRFVTSAGEYREAKFSLGNSKQAIQAALGSDVEVKPDEDEA